MVDEGEKGDVSHAHRDLPTSRSRRSLIYVGLDALAGARESCAIPL